MNKLKLLDAKRSTCSIAFLCVVAFVGCKQSSVQGKQLVWNLADSHEISQLEGGAWTPSTKNLPDSYYVYYIQGGPNLTFSVELPDGQKVQIDGTNRIGVRKRGNSISSIDIATEAADASDIVERLTLIRKQFGGQSEEDKTKWLEALKGDGLAKSYPTIVRRSANSWDPEIFAAISPVRIDARELWQIVVTISWSEK